MAKLYFPIIKRNISTTFEAVFGKMNFWGKIDRRGPYKIVKILYSQNGVREYFLAKLFVPLIKRNVITTFKVVFGKLNFWRKIDRRDPYKIVKILYYLKMGKKRFFGKIICSTHQKKQTSNFAKNLFLPHFEIVQNFHYFVRLAPVDFPSKTKFSKN